MPAVLIVDDLVSIHEMLDAVIQPNGFSTGFATDGEKGLAKYKAEKFDVVLADIDMKPVDGLTLLKNIRIYDPAAVVILITAYASTDSAIQALKYGAFDYIAKPFKVDELIKALRRGVEFRKANLERAEREASGEKPAVVVGQNPIPGNSPRVKRLLQQVTKVLTGRSPILIQGEIGTGKRRLAGFIHESACKTKPLVVVDCAGAAEPGALLFGPAGDGGPAARDAKDGILLLQNVQSLTPPLQQQLARFLQSGRLDARLICTATEDLEAMMNEGRFSEELFYRIASLPLTVPPLRERADDIPFLVREIAARTANPAFDGHQIEFTDDALKLLGTYRWPGNVLELEQVISKAVSTTETRVITAAQLPLRLNQLREWPKLSEYLAGQRRQYIQMVLHACRDDKRLAVEILGIDPAEVEN